jgi:hypothetical protein
MTYVTFSCPTLCPNAAIVAASEVRNEHRKRYKERPAPAPVNDPILPADESVVPVEGEAVLANDEVADKGLDGASDSGADENAVEAGGGGYDDAATN